MEITIKIKADAKTKEGKDRIIDASHELLKDIGEIFDKSEFNVLTSSEFEMEIEP